MNLVAGTFTTGLAFPHSPIHTHLYIVTDAKYSTKRRHSGHGTSRPKMINRSNELSWVYFQTHFYRKRNLHTCSSDIVEIHAVQYITPTLYTTRAFMHSFINPQMFIPGTQYLKVYWMVRYSALTQQPLVSGNRKTPSSKTIQRRSRCSADL